jgi:hypothetical protein
LLGPPPIADPKGLVLIEYESGDPAAYTSWNVKDVTAATFSLGTQWPTKADAPPC